MDTERPLVTYGSRAYKVLCYSKMAKRPVDVISVKNCLGGVFYRPGIQGIRAVMNGLVDKSMLEYNEETSSWEITNRGLREIIEAVSYYRIKRHRDIGPRFMAMIREELAQSSEIGPYMSQEQMDAEDAVIEKMHEKLKDRGIAKHGKKGKTKTETL